MDEDRMAYDPDQDPEEARNLRRQYRHLEQELTGPSTWCDATGRVLTRLPRKPGLEHRAGC